MDIFAHGLWTNAAYKGISRVRKRGYSKKYTWLAIFFGIAPDIFSFGPLLVMNIFTTGPLWPYMQARVEAEWGTKTANIMGHWMSSPPKTPDPEMIPQYVHLLYNFTHSLVIFAAVFFLSWLLCRKLYWFLGGWGLHVAIDIFSHNDKFFPTPFLFPVSDFHINGVSWAEPGFMLANYAALIAIYLWLYAVGRKKNNPSPQL
jgi:hypothetical protein